MPTETKSLLATATEKPPHYRYLKEFRVDQCQLFPLHKCTQHRPFTCFNWHFPNQRRRRPLRRRDGIFNYSPDSYCSKYDETSGTCPDGDDCPLLHRTAGDTERRYHLRYFKTCMCVYETDARGFCAKNGAHCAFAHGEGDKRPPVYDIRELQNQEQNLEPEIVNGPNQLDKERNMMVDDPKWQDASYVLLHYKTEQCKRPPRLCRQGYACPQYHNLRDRRRSPKKFKYRSTPCPNVKHGDEWGEPALCDESDECPYCHTRTEQQFHPEIYKSSKCNDVFTNQYCPRGPFCAFAHADQEMSINRNLPTDTNFADILSNVLPTASNPIGIGGSGGVIGSKSGGETNNNHNSNGNGTSSSILSSSLNSNNNNANGLDGLGGYFNSTGGGMTDFSDVLRNTCGSPLDQAMIGGGSSFYGNPSSSTHSSSNTIASGNNGGGNNPVSFGTQSFASAVGGGTDRSNSVNSTTSHGSKFFDDQSKLVDSLMNGPKGTNGGGLNLYENFDILSFNSGTGGGDDQRDAYSLFPSSMGMKTPTSAMRNDLSRGDSPSIDKDLETDHFSSGGSKPVSIPASSSSLFGRERFPSGSSSMAGSLNSSFSIGGSLFSKLPDASIDKKPDIFSSIFDYPQQRQENSTTLSMSPSSSNGFSSGNGPGPIGPSNNGFNGPAFLNFMIRPDLTYQNTTLMNVYLNQCKTWAETLSKALQSATNKDHPNYSCLSCKVPDRQRTVLALPCEHQVLCVNCGPVIRACPLCGNPILSRKPSNLMPHNNNMDL
ncbi:probable serine/threonine-protein kinase ndrD isoform X2 [Folsomia candida]|uniref:RING finger protein unkempt n=1 Tax=Folsomia candida TaxID=158441 RepID=A0A226ED18_FOLCA|nr:probable serine/threonine-protein kinase ndrD isoform X2 [Folsomia candida]OXA55452.1 RING finger protein unkempt [Folsomia candida]